MVHTVLSEQRYTLAIGPNLRKVLPKLRFRGEEILLPPRLSADTVDFSTEALSRRQNSLFGKMHRFLLHGTNTNNTSLNILAGYFSGLDNGTYTYRSYLPEVRLGSGIETGKDAATQPAYRMAIRDMGDFRIQLISKRLKAFRQLYETVQATPLESNKRIGEFFGIAKPVQPIIAPIIKDILLDPIFNPSEKTFPSASFETAIQDMMHRLQNEANKITRHSPGKPPEIIDTHWLSSQAEKCRLNVNWSVDRPSSQTNTINPRIIGLRDIERVESHLHSLEKRLAEALKNALGKKLSKAKSSIEETGIETQARYTARVLMNRLAPAGVGVGHSQGGPVLAMALLKSQGKGFNHSSQPAAPNADLAGRFLDIIVSLAGPMKGLPERPAWIKPMVNMIPYELGRIWMTNSLWQMGQSMYHATKEVRAGFPMMLKLQQGLNQLRQAGKTVFSIANHDDPKVEPVAAELPKAKNLFTRVLSLPLLPQKTYIEGFLPPFFIPVRWEMPKMEQHWATAVYPEEVFEKDLESRVFRSANHLDNILSTGNAESLVLHALTIWNQKYRQTVLNPLISTPSAFLEKLEAFDSSCPGFLENIVPIAEQGAFVEGTSGYMAQQLVEDTLNRLETLLEKAHLTPEQSESLLNLLEPLSSANSNLSRHFNVSQRTKSLLKKLA